MEVTKLSELIESFWKVLTESTGKPGNFIHKCGSVVLCQIVIEGGIKTEVPYCPKCEERQDPKGPIPKWRRIIP